MGIRRFYSGFDFYLHVLQLLLSSTVLRFDPASSCVSAFFIPHLHHHRAGAITQVGPDSWKSRISELQLQGTESSIGLHMTSPKRLVRIQEAPDQCLQHISSIEDIHAKIESARGVQGQYRDSSLLKRQWVNCNHNPPSLDAKDNNDGSSENGNGDSKTKRSSNSRTSSFKVLQFNTLAEGLSSGPIPPPFERTSNNKGNKLKSIYGGFCDIPNPEISLNFSLRQWRLMEVLLGCDDFDIIAMEEIDHHYGFFEPLLKIAGYAGIYSPKPYSPGVQSGWYSDGCSFFWKEGVFELQKEVVKSSFDVGSQIYVIAVMKHIASETFIVFAMTHLKSGKGRAVEEIRTEQCRQLLKHVDQVAQSTADELDLPPSCIPIVILGDFNSDIREENSCINTILSKEQKGTCQMRSAYEINPPPENFFTTWKTRGTSTAKRVIDYIFFSPGRGIDCTEILDVPKNEDMEETLLPGFKYPSDHLAIGATLNILDC